MKTVLSIDVAKNKSMIMLMDSEGEILIDSKEIKHKCITAQPLLEEIVIEKYLDDIELVVVGGESDFNARTFNCDWALSIREQCIRKNVNFEFRQCGAYTIKDGKQYKIQTKDLCKQAKLANINYKKQ